jgi:hypothetical protein
MGSDYNEVIKAASESSLLVVDLERGLIGRVVKSLPVLREKKMIITTDENY